jgi:hypothetical protein
MFRQLSNWITKLFAFTRITATQFTDQGWFSDHATKFESDEIVQRNKTRCYKNYEKLDWSYCNPSRLGSQMDMDLRALSETSKEVQWRGCVYFKNTTNAN